MVVGNEIGVHPSRGPLPVPLYAISNQKTAADCEQQSDAPPQKGCLPVACNQHQNLREQLLVSSEPLSALTPKQLSVSASASSAHLSSSNS